MNVECSGLDCVDYRLKFRAPIEPFAAAMLIPDKRLDTVLIVNGASELRDDFKRLSELRRKALATLFRLIGTADLDRRVSTNRTDKIYRPHLAGIFRHAAARRAAASINSSAVA
jgi:hypothetical protein